MHRTVIRGGNMSACEDTDTQAGLANSFFQAYKAKNLPMPAGRRRHSLAMARLFNAVGRKKEATKITFGDRAVYNTKKNCQGSMLDFLHI